MLKTRHIYIVRMVSTALLYCSQNSTFIIFSNNILISLYFAYNTNKLQLHNTKIGYITFNFKNYAT